MELYFQTNDAKTNKVNLTIFVEKKWKTKVRLSLSKKFV